MCDEFVLTNSTSTPTDGNVVMEDDMRAYSVSATPVSSYDFDSSGSSSYNSKTIYNLEKTLRGWRMLVVERPNDPMVFYWMEMCNWFEQRIAAAQAVCPTKSCKHELEDDYEDYSCSSGNSSNNIGPGRRDDGEMEKLKQMVKKARVE